MAGLPFRGPNSHIVIFFVLSLTTKIYCDGIANAHSSAVSGDEAPPVHPAPSTPISPPFGYPGGFGGIFPGFGGGFSKKLELNAGGGLGGGWPFPAIGAYPGAIGGPVPDGVPVGDVNPGAFGLPFGGLVGPSYIPQTWLGSALSAKGDLLFPVVIFIFFVVGVWTVIQFLLALVVPIIAGKFGVEKAVLDHKLHSRALSEEEKQTENLNNLMTIVSKSLNKFKNANCNYHMACNMGNSAHSKNTTESFEDIFKQLDKTEVNDPKLITIFQESAKTGDVNCNEKYPCKPNSDQQKETNSKSKTHSHIGL